MIILYMIKRKREGDIIRQKRIWYPGATYHAMAIGVLQEGENIAAKELNQYGFIGELSLDGSLRACCGILPMIYHLSYIIRGHLPQKKVF